MNRLRIIMLALGSLSAIGNTFLVLSVASVYTTTIVSLTALLIMSAILFVGMLLGEFDSKVNA